MKQDIFDVLKIEKKTWYAYGEYMPTNSGRKSAEAQANKIRDMGGKARLITRKTGIQVYTNDKKYL